MSNRDRFNSRGGPDASSASGSGGRIDEDVARDLLSVLVQDDAVAPEELSDQTIRKVQNELTSRDLIDLTTFVFLMRFCAPLLDLIAALFGMDPGDLTDRRNDDD